MSMTETQPEEAPAPVPPPAPPCPPGLVAPSTPALTYIGAENVELTWTYWPEAPAKGFRVLYCKGKKGPWTEHSPVMPASQRSCYLAELSFDTEYSVRVAALGERGSAAISPQATFTTAMIPSP